MTGEIILIIYRDCQIVVGWETFTWAVVVVTRFGQENGKQISVKLGGGVYIYI